MAHLIEADNMVYAGDKPWHGIGYDLGVSDNATVAQVLEAKPILGSEIRHEPALVMVNGEPVKVPGEYVTLRDFDNKPLGVVGEQHKGAGDSPRRMLESLENIFGDGRACLHTAMFLRDGKVMVVTAKLGAPIEVTAPNGKKDATDFYLTAVTSFDGSMKRGIYETIVRVVCNNTLRASLASLADDKKQSKIRHTSNFENRLVNAEEEWANYVTKYELFKNTIEVFAKAPIVDDKALEIIRAAFGVKNDTSEADVPTRTKNNILVVQDLYNGGMGNADFTGTAWGVLNSLTEYADHRMVVRGVRDASGAIMDHSEEARSKMVDSSLFGAGDAFKNNAFKLVSQAIGLTA